MAKIVLASQSPRRQELLRNIGITEFDIRVPEADETYPEGLSPQEIVAYISRVKADAAAALCAAAVVAGEFKAGFSRVDITPPLGVYMPGYYEARHAKSILDPLQINCVAFSDGAKTALVMQFDTEALSDFVADRMRDAVVKATDVDRNAILLHASHTHDGGQLTQGADGGAPAGTGLEPLTDL